MNLSIIIPAFNESKRIVPTLKKVEKFIKTRYSNYEIIVVDDCSNDKTKEIVNDLNLDCCKVFSNKKNMGKGYSVRKGILGAKYENILFTDSDLATPIEEIEKFEKYLKKYDVIIASRNLKQSKIKVFQPKYRQMLGNIFPYLVSIFVLGGIKDTQCGFKLFKRKSIMHIIKKMKINRFAFDVEMLFIAKKFGYKIIEVPVIWVDQKGSKVNPLNDSFNMFFDILKIC